MILSNPSAPAQLICMYMAATNDSLERYGVTARGLDTRRTCWHAHRGCVSLLVHVAVMYVCNARDLFLNLFNIIDNDSYRYFHKYSRSMTNLKQLNLKHH